MKTQQIPLDAEYYAAGGIFASQLPTLLSGHARVIANLNSMNAANFKDACANWLNGAARSRDMGLPLPPKPLAIAPRVINQLGVLGPALPPAPEDTALLVVPAQENGATAAGVYVWESDGTPAVCPDLPPAAPTHTGVSLMQQLVDEGSGKAGDPTIPIVAVNNMSKSSNGMTWVRVLLVLLAFAFSARHASAQVRVACTPEPLAVMNSLRVKSMGQWALFMRNDGDTARTIQPEEIYMAIISIRPIDPASAITVLSDRQSHSTAARVVKVLSIAGQLAGVGLALASKANATVGTALAVGSGLLQPVINIATGEVPPTGAFTVNLLASAITLPAGGAATRTVFASKQHAPAPISVVLP